MIEINLLPGKKKKAAKAGIELPDFGELIKGIRDPLLVGAVAVWIVVVVAAGYIFVTTNSRLAALEEEKSAAEAEYRVHRRRIAQKEREDALRDSLVVERDAIREIDSDRYVWAHVLAEVTNALPDVAWLTGIEFLPAAAPQVGEEVDFAVQPLVGFRVYGRAASVDAVTRFFGSLSDSPWITDVRLGGIEAVSEDERAVQEFSVTAAFQQADSEIRLVSLQETLR